MELRWDGVASLADALRMLREQASRTPVPQWARAVGGWSELQFVERRMAAATIITELVPAGRLVRSRKRYSNMIGE